jgi:preprotein translocase subunit Sec61beta
MSTKKAPATNLKFFGEESSGLRIQPKTVLIVSLIYIGIVVLLHIWAKLTAPAVAPAESTSDIPEKPNAKVTE